MKFLIFNMVVGASLVYLVTAGSDVDRGAGSDAGRQAGRDAGQVVAQSMPAQSMPVPVETVAAARPEPVTQPEIEVQPVPAVQPVPVAQPVPVVKSAPVVQPEPEPEPELEPAPASAPAPAPELVPEPVTLAASQEQVGAGLQVGQFEIAEPENLMSARERSVALRALARDMELKFLDRR
jgi:hypothetical protein